MSGIRDRMNRLRGIPSNDPEDGRGKPPAAEDGQAAKAAPPDELSGETGLRDAGAVAAAAAETGGMPVVCRDRQDGRAESAGADGVSPEEAEEEPLHPLFAAMGVKLARSAHGSFLLRRVEVPLDTRHGDHRFAQLLEAAPALGAFHGSDESVAADRVLFFDLETTGLGVGAGNVPFMIGLGCVQGGSYAVEQTVIRHPAEERAMLAYLLELLPRFPYLATYNGKTFDWPVLESRFIMNGFGRVDYKPKHLDFLHPSRSVWRNTLASCKLSRIEEERLGIFRKDDLPGAMAPQMYFRFLSDGNPAHLEGVYRHNEWDMLALACLAVRFGFFLDGRLGTDVTMPTEPEELLRTGLWLEKMGFGRLAEPLFARLAQAAEPSPSWCLPLAARDKRCGNWERAVVLWQKAASEEERLPAATGEAHIELAMYHEHRERNYAAALGYAETALELAARRLSLHRGDPKRRAELEAIRKRAERLRRKLGRDI